MKERTFRPWLYRAHRRAAETRAAPAPEDGLVLDAVGWQPTSLEQLVIRTELSLPTVSLALARLEAGGWVTRQGAWYERIVRDGRHDVLLRRVHGSVSGGATRQIANGRSTGSRRTRCSLPVQIEPPPRIRSST